MSRILFSLRPEKSKYLTCIYKKWNGHDCMHVGTPCAESLTPLECVSPPTLLPTRRSKYWLFEQWNSLSIYPTLCMSSYGQKLLLGQK